MQPVTLQAVLRDSIGKDREGKYQVPERKSLTVHLSRDANGLTLHRITSILIGETYVRLETVKGATFYVAFEDVRAVVVEEVEKKAGFV